jgi:hypothetical protein
MTIEDYRAEIRAAVRGFWIGAGDYDWFLDAMFAAISRQVPLAYHEGVAECGIAPDEITFEEKMDIQRAILEQKMFVGGFAEYIEQRTKMQGGKLGPLLSRVEVWVQRYNEVRERAKSKACADMKCEWIFGDTVDHCRDCSAVVGRVYRISIWDKYGWIPGSKDLACGGWRCDCKREPTDAPVTKGRPPSVKG